MRHTRGHSANRRSHHALEVTGMVSCANCKAIKRSHAVCQACGVYRGRVVVDKTKQSRAVNSV